MRLIRNCMKRRHDVKVCMRIKCSCVDADNVFHLNQKNRDHVMGKVNDKSRVTEAAELRRLAEEKLRSQTAELHPPRPREETQRLVHELEVQLIELDMQNKELHLFRD